MMTHNPNPILKNEMAKLTEELKSTKGIIVVIINRTKDVLLRSDFGSICGKWKKFPEDEFLYPNQFTIIAEESYGMMSGVEGFIEYSKGNNLSPNEVVYPLLFSWKIPYVGSRSFDCGEDALRKDSYSIHKSVFMDENPSQLVFTIHNDDRDTTPFSSVFMKPSSQTPISKGNNVNPNVQVRYGPILKDSWKCDLTRGNQKFSQATVENLTERLMERGDFVLNGGIFRKEPNRFVLPGKIADWGVESSGLTGFSGYIIYHLHPEGNYIRLDFATAVIGKNKYKESLVDGKGDISLKIEKRAEDSHVSWKVFQSNLMNGPRDTNQAQSIYSIRVQELVAPRLMPPESYVGGQKETFQAQHRQYSQSQQISGVTNVNSQVPTVPVSPSFNQQNQTSNSSLTSNPKSPVRNAAYFEVLNARGEEGLPNIDNAMGLNNYYHLSNKFWEQATSSRKGGDKEGAYVNLIKYTTLVLQKIPSHISYNSTRFDDDKVVARQRCIKAIKELEDIQNELSSSSPSKQEEDLPIFPSVPKT